MKSSRIFVPLAMLAFACFAVACGGGGEPACESAGAALCEAACACGGDDGCIIGDATSSTSFESEEDCKFFFVTLGCAGDDGSLDGQFDACTAALDQASCVDAGDGAQGLDEPSECIFSE